ncbi:hypothetical protein ACFQX7_36360 [Luedemannella flava]
MTLEQISPPGRLAEAGEQISAQELALAARNHGMPLEAMRADLTRPACTTCSSTTTSRSSRRPPGGSR